MSNSSIVKTTVLSVLILSFLTVSCVERINIKLDSGYERLVVDGAVTTDTMAQTVKLSKSTSYYYDQPPPPVTGANVRISDGDSVYDLTEESPGIYRTGPSVYGIPGKVYTLDITLAASVGGFNDYTATSTLFPVTHLDSIGLLFHPDWTDAGIWEVKCFAKDPPSKDYYRFMVSKNRKMLTDTLYEWFVTDDRLFNGNYIYGAPIGYIQQNKVDEKLKAGDTITVEMNSIGKDYESFILEAQSEVRGSFPLFSGPPANVKGNLSNGAIGFFAVYSITRASTVVTVTPAK